MQDRDALQALRRLARRIGGDPLLVQGAGGNMSIKTGDTLWVKASGTWLADAERDEIFVPVALPAAADHGFRVRRPNPLGLRPSIETSLHAALPQAVVLHVHGVDAIAWAVQADAASLLADRLHGLSWALIGYRQPGPTLTAAIRAAMRPDMGVFILANHGLVIAAETVDSAEALLGEVTDRLAIPPRAAPPVPGELAGEPGFRPVADPVVRALAIDPVGLAIATAGPLYPDHVVFLGPAPLLVDTGAALGPALARFAAGQPQPRWAIVRGEGVLIAEDVPRGGEEMLRCLADVAARIPAGAELRVLGDAEVAALMNWEAEAYRRHLARARGDEPASQRALA